MENYTGRRGTERLVADLASTQHGVVTQRQLNRLGMTPRMIHRRLSDGRFRRLHRGVYLAGPLLSPRTAEMAAVLACGDRAVISHEGAGSLWGILPAREPDAPACVTVLRSHGARKRAGIRLHGTTHLPSEDRTTLDRIPVTSVTRTLLDLAACTAARGRFGGRGGTSALPVRDLEQALARAAREGLVDLGALEARLGAHEGRPGTALLRTLVRTEGGPSWTRSEAEESLLALVRRARLPPPAWNARVAGFEIDALWTEQGIGVEVDGFAFHGSRSRFEGDRRRDAELAAAGIHVLRVTWRQLRDEPEAVIGRVAQSLGRAAATRGVAGPR